VHWFRYALCTGLCRLVHWFEERIVDVGLAFAFSGLCKCVAFEVGDVEQMFLRESLYGFGHCPFGEAGFLHELGNSDPVACFALPGPFVLPAQGLADDNEYDLEFGFG